MDLQMNVFSEFILRPYVLTPSSAHIVHAETRDVVGSIHFGDYTVTWDLYLDVSGRYQHDDKTKIDCYRLLSRLDKQFGSPRIEISIAGQAWLRLGFIECLSYEWSN